MKDSTKEQILLLASNCSTVDTVAVFKPPHGIFITIENGIYPGVSVLFTLSSSLFNFFPPFSFALTPFFFSVLTRLQQFPHLSLTNLCAAAVLAVLNAASSNGEWQLTKNEHGVVAVGGKGSFTSWIFRRSCLNRVTIDGNAVHRRVALNHFQDKACRNPKT